MVTYDSKYFNILSYHAEQYIEIGLHINRISDIHF